MTDPNLTNPTDSNTEEESFSDISGGNYLENLLAQPKESKHKKNVRVRLLDQEYNIGYKIHQDELYAVLELELKPNQIVLVDANSVTTMDESTLFISKLRGGLLDVLRQTLGQDGLFLSQFTAEKSLGHLSLTPALPGDIYHYFLTSEKGIYLKSDAFLACQPTTKLDTAFSDIKYFYNDSQTYLLRLIGTGDLWFSVCGGLIEIPNTSTMVYNPDYVAAFEDTLDYTIVKKDQLSTEKLRSDVWGGQGRLCRFLGEGKIWLQARQTNSFLDFVQSFLGNLRFPRLS